MASNDTIWSDLAPPLRKFIRRRVRDGHAADDLLQDVLLKAQANIAAAPPAERLSAWLFQIARNTVIDYYRSPKSRPAPAVDEAIDLPAAVDAPDEDLTHELAGCLAPMIDKLPEPYREALTLADREGLTQRAIADRLGLSLPGAKSRVQRARKLLRDMMVDCCAVRLDRTGRVLDHRPTAKSKDYCGGAPGSCCDR